MIKSIINKIKNVFVTRNLLDIKIKRMEQHINNQRLIEKLQMSSIQSIEMGITNDNISKHEVVVSLTSYGKRIRRAHLTIESIMLGSVKPNRIILWIQDDLKNKPLPKTLQNQTKRGLEIRYCEDLRSYKKLIPTLQLYPEAAIITLDDDLIYNYDLVENLVNAYNQDDGFVYATRMHRIKISDDNKKPLLYAQWDFCTNETNASPLNFLTGGGGTLYPPHVFREEVFNQKVYMSLCKNADDIWFNAMLRFNDVLIKRIDTGSKNGEEFFELDEDPEVGLKYLNTDIKRSIKRNANDDQFEAVFSYYHLYDKLLK